MRKIIIIIFLFFILWLYWNRSFYCLEDKKCITVWKTFNNTCFIVPGKYYSFLWPTTNYVKTLNTNDIVIYWSKDLPVNSLIVRCSGEYQIINKKKELIIFDYKNDLKFREIIYGTGSKRFNEIKENATLIDIDIKENYAVDKDGVKL